jgi:alanine racemase
LTTSPTEAAGGAATGSEAPGAILTVDLAAVAANYRLLRDRLGGSECGACVKGDAYGVGMAAVSRTLASAGCRTFFVATVDEGLALRRLLPEATVYALNGIAAGGARAAAASGLRPVLNSLGDIEIWSGLSGRPPAALHIDTGLNRLGLAPKDVALLAREPARLARLSLPLVISHLACADEPAQALNEQQRLAFVAAAGALFPSGQDRPLLSLAASSGIFLGPGYYFDLARPGASLLGLSPNLDLPNPMAPAVRLEAAILQVRDLAAGESVGYGASWRAARPTCTATVAVGYADGYFRALGCRGGAWVGGHRLPVLGRVSMDLVTLDVTDAPAALVRPGAFVELIGPHDDADGVAARAGTIGYELLTRLGPRLRRRYLGAAILETSDGDLL